MSVRMRVTAVGAALVLISMPPGTHQNSASAIVAGLETGVLSVSGFCKLKNSMH